MKRVVIIAICVINNLGWAIGQDRPADPLRQHLFPPELIMRNQRELDLDEEQRSYIVEQIQQAQSQFTSMQWELQREVQQLSDLLGNPNAPEEELVGQLDRVLDLEKRIKRARLLLAVRIKNRLTAEQRATLNQLKRRGVRHGAGPERRPQRQTRPGLRDGQPAFR